MPIKKLLITLATVFSVDLLSVRRRLPGVARSDRRQEGDGEDHEEDGCETGTDGARRTAELTAAGHYSALPKQARLARAFCHPLIGNTQLNHSVLQIARYRFGRSTKPANVRFYPARRAASGRSLPIGIVNHPAGPGHEPPVGHAILISGKQPLPLAADWVRRCESCAIKRALTLHFADVACSNLTSRHAIGDCGLDVHQPAVLDARSRRCLSGTHRGHVPHGKGKAT